MSPLKAPECLEDHHFLWGDAMFFSPRIYWWIAAPLKKKIFGTQKNCWFEDDSLIFQRNIFWFHVFFQCVDEMSPPSTLKHPIVGGKGFCLWLRVRFDQNSAGIFLSKCIAPQMSLSCNQPLDRDRILTHSTIDKLSWKLHIQSGRLKFQLLISWSEMAEWEFRRWIANILMLLFPPVLLLFIWNKLKKKDTKQKPTMIHWSKEWPLIHCDGT